MTDLPISYIVQIKTRIDSDFSFVREYATARSAKKFAKALAYKYTEDTIIRVVAIERKIIYKMNGGYND